jgi:hypothetical protein
VCLCLSCRSADCVLLLLAPPQIRNATHNLIYAESFGARAMATPTPGDPSGVGVFRCLPGDDCQMEVYDYGPITSDYPHFPVETEARWCLHNSYRGLGAATQVSVQAEPWATY